MHTEVGSAIPYYEFYASGIALVIKTARSIGDSGVLALAMDWLNAEISLQSLGRDRVYRIMIPGGRIGDIKSQTKNTIHALCVTGDYNIFGSGRPESSGDYNQSVAMFTLLFRDYKFPVIIPSTDRLHGLLFNLNVELYDLGFRLWFNDLSSGRGKDQPRVYGGPWWGIAAKYDGTIVDSVSWHHFGVNYKGNNENGRGAKAWGGRSLLMPRALAKVDMGRLRDSFVLGKNGVDREAAIVEGGQGAPKDKSSKSKPKDKPKQKPKDKPDRDKPVDKDDPVDKSTFSTIGQHTPVGHGSFCELCYLGTRQHNMIEPGMQVPRRIEGDRGKGPPKEWGVDALGKRRI
jgi:hypothetical protein